MVGGVMSLARPIMSQSFVEVGSGVTYDEAPTLLPVHVQVDHFLVT